MSLTPQTCRWLARIALHTLLGALGALALPGVAWSGEWPQILGPHRNGVADAEQLVSRLPSGGPKTLWHRPVGSGFAGVAVARGKTLLLHRVGDHEVAEAMDAVNGTVVWKREFATRYQSQVSPDDGPRCVPVVHDDAVYLYGAEGHLHCVALDDGTVRWSRPARRQLGAQDGYFGAGSTPLVEDGRLLVNIGARRAGLVAFDLKSGETVWSVTDEGASYASPVAATIDGVRHVIFVTRLSCLSIDPRDGQIRFQFPFGKRGPTVNAANPLVLGDHVFVSASYGVGAKLAKINAESAQVVWENDTTMSSQYTTCVEHDGVLYGVDGREDVGVARLRAFDPMTGEVFWTEEGFGKATLILADNRLVIVTTDGQLVLAAASKEAYRELDRATLFESTTRALPALANGRLYVRDTQTLKCFDLRRGS